MQRQVAEGRHLRVGSGVLTATAQQGPDTGKQLLRLKGFGQVVVRTGVQAADAVIQLTAGGEHQHRQPPRSWRSRAKPSMPGSMASSTSRS